MKRLPVWVVFGLLLCAGCNGDKTARKSEKKPEEESAREQNDDQKVWYNMPSGGGGGQIKGRVGLIKRGEKGPDQKDAERKPAPPDAPARKIIYTANLDLIVDDLSQAEETLLDLVDKYKGLVAQSSITGSRGTPRQGRWRFRIPVERLKEFRREVVKLGVPETNTIDSEDVTGRYYDLEASIKTYKASEETLRKLMDKAVGKVDELLAVEKELAARREKIEQLQGEVNVLSNLSALTTVNVTFREIKNYVPPEAPTFGSRLGSTFADSVEALGGFGRGLVLIGAAIVPWLPLLAIVLIPSWIVVRRRLRRARTNPPAPLAGLETGNP
jgi:hypothetical protein